MKKITSVILCLVLFATLFCTFDITAFAVGDITSITQIAAAKSGIKIKWSNSWSKLSSKKISYDIKIVGASSTIAYKKIKSTTLTVANKLQPGRNYSVIIRSRNGKTVGKWSSPKTVTTCCADVNVRQTGFGNRKVKLEWSASSGAAGYKIYQKNILKNGSASYKRLASTTKTKKTVSIPALSSSSYKQVNAALIVVPVRKISGFKAESQIKNVSKRAYLYCPKVKPFMTYTPTVSNNTLVFRSNNWVSGFNYRLYSYEGKLIESKSVGVTDSNEASVTLKAGKLYQVEAQSYITVGGITAKSYWSSRVEVYTKPEIRAKWDSNLNLKVSWSKVSDISGYNFKIQQVGNKSNLFRVKYLTTNSVIISKSNIKGLNFNHSYKLSVLPYKNSGGNTVSFKTSSVKTKKVEVIGHRGAMDLAPESTKASFKKAQKCGYDSFECDYWETKNGDLLVYHDLYMTSCGHPKLDIRKIKAKNVKKYPIIQGSNVDKYATQYIPTVEQVIKYASKLGMKLYLHTKDIKTSNKAIKKIDGWLKKYNMSSKTVVFSGYSSCAERIDTYLNGGKGYLIYATSWQQIHESILYMGRHSMKTLIMQRNDYLDKALIDLAHSYGIKVGCYGVNKASHAAKIVNQSSDFLVTNIYSIFQ